MGEKKGSETPARAVAWSWSVKAWGCGPAEAGSGRKSGLEREEPSPPSFQLQASDSRPRDGHTNLWNNTTCCGSAIRPSAGLGIALVTLLAHLVNTDSQYNLPPLSKKLVYSASRGELDLPARFTEPCDSGPSARLLPAQPTGRRRGDDKEQRLQNQRRDQ